jgi:hypothetical protein
LRRLALAGVLLVSRAWAQAPDPDAPSLRVETWKDGVVVVNPQVKVGEPFHVVITAAPRPDVVVGMPAALDAGKLEITDRDEATVPGSGERIFDLTVVAWEPGKQEFPPLPITYVAKGQSELREIRSAPFEIDVLAVVGDESAELRPLAPPVPVYERDYTLVKLAAAAAGALLVAGVVALLVRSARRRRRVAAAAAVVDLRPAHEIALEKLAALSSGPLLGDDDRRPYYFALTEIVREYLGRRYGFAALDMTSQELLDAVAAVPEAAPIRGELEGWLGACDLVKFARVPASRDEAAGALERARALVETTTPPPLVQEVARAP